MIQSDFQAEQAIIGDIILAPEKNAFTGFT